MKITLIAVGQKMPGWVTDAWNDFAGRLSGDCTLSLLEIPAVKRGKNADLARIARDEGQKMLAAIPGRSRVVALDERGRMHDTRGLSQRLDNWMQGGQDISLLVGGPEGLAPECLQRADEKWSLSPLTLPHPMVRVIVAAQLFRAWGILHNHPYHTE